MSAAEATVGPSRVRSASTAAGGASCARPAPRRVVVPSRTPFSSFSQSQSQSSISTSASPSTFSPFAHTPSSALLTSSSSSSTLNNPSSAPPSSSSGSSTRPRMMRNNSHLSRTGPGALVIPVPPTLANSPHLQSPNSIFRRSYPGPRASPDVEEERWLRDTIPIGSADSESSFPLSAESTGGSGSDQGRGRANSVVGTCRTSASPCTSPFSLLPSSLPRSGVAYTHAHSNPLSSREHS